MSTSRRLAVLQAHLGDGGSTETEAGLEPHPTSAQQGEQGASYSVVLPETLTPKGPWLVRRWVQVTLAPLAAAPPHWRRSGPPLASAGPKHWAQALGPRSAEGPISTA